MERSDSKLGDDHPTESVDTLSQDTPEPIPFATLVDTNQPLAKSVSVSPTKMKWVHSGTRRILESMILFLATILFLRAFAVEPFGVPTGSMAPTLTGDHRCVLCPNCEFPVRVGKPIKEEGFATRLSPAECPNCGERNLPLQEAPIITGDRLLVDKNVFHIRKPNRWEVVVFWCPNDLSKPYVKRVVALPKEKVFIQDGDIYINGELSRKTLMEAKEMMVPLFDMSYGSKKGWQDRWSIEGPPEIPPDADLSKICWIVVSENEIRLEGSREPNRSFSIEYINKLFDERSNKLQERTITDWFVYNQSHGYTQPVHDFYVSFDLEVLPSSGWVSCQLNDGRDQTTTYFAVGETRELTQLVHEKAGVVKSNNLFRLVPKRTFRIEMAQIDRRTSVLVDGKEIFSPFDMEAASTRNDVSRPVKLGMQGASVIVRNLKLCRDVHYRSLGDNAVGSPSSLGLDEYFMLGDNSGNSDDSRTWKIPGVPERNIFGKPFLLHQPSKRANFSVSERNYEFQSIDWSRIRWIR